MVLRPDDDVTLARGALQTLEEQIAGEHPFDVGRPGPEGGADGIRLLRPVLEGTRDLDGAVGVNHHAQQQLGCHSGGKVALHVIHLSEGAVRQ